MSTGWIAAIAGFLVAGTALYKMASSTSDSKIDTPWYVPQIAEDYANAEAARIQQEQKARLEAGLMRAFAQGGLVMLGVGIVLGAMKAGPRRSSR